MPLQTNAAALLLCVFGPEFCLKFAVQGLKLQFTDVATDRIKACTVTTPV